MATDAPLLHYNKATGQWATALVDRNGKYQKKIESKPSNSFGSWTHIVGSGAGTVLFYNKDNGQFATGRLGMDGSFNTHRVSDPGAFHPWTHIAAAGLRFRKASDSVNPVDQPYLFYNKGNGEWATGVMTPDAEYVHRHTGEGFDQWSHVVGAGNGALLFYNKDTGKFTTGVLSADATSYEVAQYGNFNPWTHVVGNGNGSLLFYNSGTRGWATGLLSRDGEYTHVHTSKDDLFGIWTNIVNCGNGCLFFYNTATGKFATGILHMNGTFKTMFVSNAGEFGSWTHVVGEAHRSRSMVHLIKLYCKHTESLSGPDLAILRYNDTDIWGPTSINNDEERTVGKSFVMKASTATVGLIDDDWPDADDDLGKITISESERGTGQNDGQFFGDETNYTLYYEVG